MFAYERLPRPETNCETTFLDSPARRASSEKFVSLNATAKRKFLRATATKSDVASGLSLVNSNPSFNKLQNDWDERSRALVVGMPSYCRPVYFYEVEVAPSPWERLQQ